MTRPIARILAVSLALALPAAAAAHHGWAWTEEKESRLEGTIEKIYFGNPHMHLQLRSEGELWEIDLSPPIVARGSGFGPDAAKVGDEAVLTGHRARNAETLGFKAETITVRGKTYDVYPRREKTL